MRTPPNRQQRAAIDAQGTVFVSAGAGTGKTSVLVERFADAVCDAGLDVGSILLITYTERAAGELRSRTAERLRERGRPDLARELDSAWISTIHGFCRRLLATYALQAGIDPRFRVLDEPQARVLQGEAFTAALEAFCASGEPERLRLLATYGSAALRRMMTSVYETLRSAGRDLVLEPGAAHALDTRVTELQVAAGALAADPQATAAQSGAAADVLELLGSSTLPERLLALDTMVARGARAATFNDARLAVRSAALEELAARDRELLQLLLDELASAYASAKRRESALDFEDLQLVARELLRNDADVCDREQLRFRSIMVDEFQDTNRLQCEIIDLLAAGSGKDVFFVGDEFQSIYGFRHADVAVFRERREAAEVVLPLSLNYRSRPSVLDAVNALFESAFGPAFEPLTPDDSVTGAEASLGAPVELLVTDKGALAESDLHWRRAEARHVARRVRELVDAGEATAGEIVLLFAAGTDAEWFEQELRAVGLPTYRDAGRRYFGQQQVVDLLSYLRLLHNRYDDEALLAVLASPFVGLSNDALLLIREAARGRPVFTGIERDLPAALLRDEVRLARAFLQRYRRLAEASGRVSLELLCERILVEHDYDLAVLAHADGKRRYANLRKLARLARSYEELRGADLEGFVRFVAEQEATGARETDAVAEEEGADAVRLLTIHAAKGLEFEVVVLADAGRERVREDDILCLSDGRFGFKVAHPATGQRVGTSSYEHVRSTIAHEAEDERLRLYYVGMTRAKRRLLVSGAADLEHLDRERTPLAWALTRLGLDAGLGAAENDLELVRGKAQFVVRVDRGTAGLVQGEAETPDAETLADGKPQLALFDEEGAPAPLLAPTLHPLPTIPDPPAHHVSRLSFSSLALFDRCSYRYYAERGAGMRPLDDHSDRGDSSAGLAATEIGDAVHRLLEKLDLAHPAPPSAADLRETVRGWYPGAPEDDLGRIAEHVAAYCGSEPAGRLAALEGVRVEAPFLFVHDGVILNGRLDVHWSDGSRHLVHDFKTNALGDADPADVVDEGYRLQRLVYALACLRTGAETVEVVYQFLERPDEPVSQTFSQDDAAALQEALSAAISRIREGTFRPTPSQFACSGCPALDVVCPGPRLLAPELDEAALVATGQ